MEHETEAQSLVARRPVLASKFDILRVLGKGAAGAVFLARELKNGRLVALKVLTNSDAFDENTKQRFVDEFKVCQSIRHPNIVESYEYIELDDGVAFTMEFVEGDDLSRLIHKRKFYWDEIDNLFTQILSAVAELHRNGIVHRDIKLENILITRDGKAKLVDLGLMRKLDQEGLTRTGVLLGTAQYMPPEYVNSGVYDERSDLYAVGLALYEILSGKRRLQNTQGVAALQHLVDTGFKVERINDSPLGVVPEKYHFILEKALEPRPKRRYQTAVEMQAGFSLPLKIDSAKYRVKIDKSYHNPPNLARYRAPAMLAVIIMAVMVGFPVRSVISPSPKFANYLGSLVGEDGTIKEIRATLSKNGMFVVLGLEGCKSGFINPKNNQIACARPGVYLELAAISETSMGGTLNDSSTGKIYTLSLKAQKES